jgi:hypothetical protein
MSTCIGNNQQRDELARSIEAGGMGLHDDRSQMQQTR